MRHRWQFSRVLLGFGAMTWASKGLLLLSVGLLTLSGGVGFAHEGRTKEIARISEALRRSPEQPRLLVARAGLYRARGEYANALADLNEAHELDPAWPELSFQRGMVFAAIGMAREAEAELSAFLVLHPRSVRALEARGRLHEHQGSFERARSDYRAALALAPKLDRYLLLATLEERMGELDSAAAVYQQGIDKLGSAMTLKLALVDVHTARRDYSAAIKVVDAMIAKSPFHVDALLRRAVVHEQAGRAAVARADREAALQQIDDALTKRTSSLRRMLRAKVLIALERRVEARAILTEVVKEAPKLVEAKALLAQTRSVRSSAPKGAQRFNAQSPAAVTRR